MINNKFRFQGSIFYNEVTTSRLCTGTTVASRSIRGGTVLHETTHAIFSTTDVGFGCSYNQGLNASQQLNNAGEFISSDIVTQPAQLKHLY